MKLSGGILDADGHVMERDAELREFLDPPYRDHGHVMAFPFFPTIDGYHRGAIHARLGHHEKEYHITAETWLDFLDGVGIEATVLYPTAGLSAGSIQDAAWATALTRAYNSWFADRFYGRSPRLRGMALLPLQDIGEAVKELRRAVTELGMVGVVLPANNSDYGVRLPLGDQHFWPVYEEAERLNVPLAVHSGPSLGLGINSFTRFAPTQSLEHPLAQFIQITSMVMEGVFERFPRLRVAYLEAGVGWVPYILDRLDRSYEVWAAAEFKEFSEWLRRRPGEYFESGRLYFSCEGGERSLVNTIERIGHKTLLFASDFPHETNLERARNEVDELLQRKDLSDEVKQGILRDNVADFYGQLAPKSSAEAAT
jgi:predicted TIM-barrel fold metal-dependent hydrolase